jgi:hypothetical protein
MLKRTDEAMRRRFYQDHLRGSSYADIAAETGFSKECVRYWCRRQRQGGSVVSHYLGPACGVLRGFHPLVRYVVLKLRLQHPGWGPGPLRLGLQKRPSLAHRRLPHTSQIGRYLHQFERFRRKKRAVPSPVRPRQPGYTTQRWQLDFKMGLPLRDGSLVNLYTCCDPFAEACVGAWVFPAGRVGQAPKKVVQEQVRTFLRACFARWQVLPSQLQTDGESTLVANRGPNDFPTTFTLWLAGLGIQHLVIRPHRPTDNSEIERMHRTVYDFALKGCRLTDPTQLNAALTDSVTTLVYELPSHATHCHGLPPIQAHPELDHPERLFQPEWELAQFDLDRVDQYLAQFTWERRVGKTGQADIGSQTYSVGRSQARKLVSVRFEPQTRQLVFSGQPDGTGKDGVELKRHVIRGCEVLDLIGFAIPALAPGPQQLPLPLDWKLTKKRYVVKEQRGV